MPKHFKILLVMVVIASSSFVAAAQTAVYKAVILDGKPSRLNINTGVITTDDGRVVLSHTADKTLDYLKKSSATSVNDKLVLTSKTTSKEKGSSNRVEKGLLDGVEHVGESEILEPESVIFHTVVEGETLYGLSKRYQTSLGALQKANNLQTTLIRAGQSLKVTHLDVIENDLNSIYIVSKGDTLYSIAKKANTTVTQLKMLNHLDGNTIRVGQEVKIK